MIDDVYGNRYGKSTGIGRSCAVSSFAVLVVNDVFVVGAVVFVCGEVCFFFFFGNTLSRRFKY